MSILKPYNNESSESIIGLKGICYKTQECTQSVQRFVCEDSSSAKIGSGNYFCDTLPDEKMKFISNILFDERKVSFDPFFDSSTISYLSQKFNFQ